MVDDPDFEIRVAEHPDALAALAAASIARWMRSAGTHPTLGLAGGTTPRAAYQRLRDHAVPWESVTMWLGDERWVPPDHPDSNAGMIRSALGDHVPARLLAIQHGDDPSRAAASYEQLLAEVLPSADTGPRPHLVLLGLGEDGHTASLFPGTAALDERKRRFVANWVPAQEAWRLTATLPLLWEADRLAFLVAGEGKAAAVAAVLAGGSGLPAEEVTRGARAVTWFLDRAAADL